MPTTHAIAVPSWTKATRWAHDTHFRYRGAVTALRSLRPAGRLVWAAMSAAILLLSLPGAALAHVITDRYQAPLPLVVYLAGAAFAVAMSFVFVMLRGGRPPRVETASKARTVPGWLRLTLQAIGLIAWLWIVIQTLVGGSGDGDVASLFLWTYGWVGVALISALLGPAWAWIDPFSTIHRLLGAAGRVLGMGGAEPAEYPERLGRWPAVIGLAAVIWLELAVRLDGGRMLGLLLVAYTLLTVAGMSYFGREQWRSRAEIFSVWFGLLGRLAPFGLEDEPESGRIRRRSFASGLITAPWTNADLALVTLGVGSIIFDGLSQTQLYFDLFVISGMLGSGVTRETIALFAFIGLLLAVVFGVARRLGVDALGAGLLPVAVGYLIAHYLSFLLVDGQRLLAALNDPLLTGANLLPFDLGFWEPTLFLPTAVLWSIQLGAVVGGHIVGAWAGHAVLASRVGNERATALIQLPLAVLMVVLTTITLWSLGQAVLLEDAVALVL